MKENQFNQEASTMIEGIRRILEESKINITIEYAKTEPYRNKDFFEQPGQVLMKEYNEKLKSV